MSSADSTAASDHPSIVRVDDPSESWSKLSARVKKVQCAMLSTVSVHGSTRLIRSRPMATCSVDKSAPGELWFFTMDASDKVRELQADPTVSLQFTDNSSLWVSVSGQGRLVRDKAKMSELYSRVRKAWFPQGLDDPHIALIRVDVQAAEYWDDTSSAVVKLAIAAKAAISGDTYKGEGQEHAKLNLQQ